MTDGNHMMRLLLTSYNTMFGRAIRKATNSDWSHVSIVHDDTVYDFSHRLKKVMTLDSFLQDPSLERYALMNPPRGVHADYERLQDDFLRVKYDTTAVIRLRSKLKSGRDNENIQSNPLTFHCAHYATSLFGVRTVYHPSQTTPADFMEYFDIGLEVRR